MITMDITSVKMALAICNKSMGNSMTQHSLRSFGNVKSRPKWSLAGKYDYIISEYFSEFPTENVGNLVAGT